MFRKFFNGISDRVKGLRNRQIMSQQEKQKVDDKQKEIRFEKAEKGNKTRYDSTPEIDTKTKKRRAKKKVGDKSRKVNRKKK